MERNIVGQAINIKGDFPLRLLELQLKSEIIKIEKVFLDLVTLLKLLPTSA